MNSFWRKLAHLFVFFALVPGGENLLRAQEAEAKEDESSIAGKIVVIRLSDDDVSDSRRVRDLERLIEVAEKEKSAALIYDIDVSKASSSNSEKKILELLSGVKLPSFTFVNSSATGAGALVALSSRAIYMKDFAIIGGAGMEAPVDDDEKNATTKQRERVQRLSTLKARARSLASKNGYDIEVAEAFVESGDELKMGETVIAAKGQVLTLTAEEATKVYDGEPLLARGIVESVEDIIQQEKLKGEVVKTNPRKFGENWTRERLSRSKDAADEEESFEGEGIFGRRDSENLKGAVVVVKIGQDALATGKARFDFMDRILKKAELDGAEAVILDIDTPGGYAWYTKGLVLNSLQNLSIPTYSFVNPRAESAGAMIAVGTDHIYMRPAATIGSALVVSGSGTDLAESMNDKVTQMAIATVRNIAEIKGHNPDIAEAFVTRDKEVKIDGVVVHEAGHVLNLNTIDATEEIGGRPVLAKGVANSLDDLIEQEGLKGKQIEAAPLGMETFAHWIQKFSFLLIIIGIAGCYMEYNSPGFGLPGIIGVAAFSLFFFGNYLAGNLAGYELAVLFILGLVLVAVEVFVFPGALIPGVVGGLLMILSLGLGMVDRVDFEWKWEGLPTDISWGSIFNDAMWSLAIGLVGALALILVLMRYLPESKMGRWLVLEGAVPSGASLSGESVDSPDGVSSSRRTYLGRKGEATTDLRPAGKGRFDDEMLDIISDGEFIPKGENIQVAKHEGSRIVVRRLD